ncbi:HlyC/CorC family transporter [candidate division WOR-3 bacterium]|nr:HlyC/CorC family transporter [candidate division WOR-3 bacterium]
MIIIILAFILLFIMYFEASEMSLVSSDEVRLANLARYKGKGYKVANKIRSKPDILLSTVLVGINLMTVLFAMLLTREIGITRGLIFSTLIIALIGEILIKSLAIVNPEALSAVIAPPLVFFYWIFFPLIFMVRWLGEGMLKIFGIRDAKENITKEEMNIAAREARVTGGIEHEQFIAMEKISRLSEMDVRDIMIPRVEIEAIDIKDEKEEIEEILKEINAFAIPVYKGTIDNIIGIISKEDIIKRGKKWKIEDILRPVKFIHGDRGIEDVLPELLSDRIGCGIVIDEYGGTEGFVSTDDILFSIIGRISSEIEEREGGSFIVDANIKPSTLDIVTDEDTLAGYIISLLEEIPGEGVKIKVGDMEMSILDANERRIKKVLIKRNI